MKIEHEAPETAKVVPTSAGGPDALPMPSEDQRFFDESLRQATVSIGNLVRGRRKVR